jgi:hypothetical protein
MNCALELHDSRVGAVFTSGDALTLNFSAAYLHKSIGVPGIDAGTGWVQEAALTFLGAAHEGSIAVDEGRIVEGDLVANGETLSILPVPFNAIGNVSAEFRFADGSAFKVIATSVCLSLLGEPRFVEEFPGT